MKNRTVLSLLTAAALIFVFAPTAEAQISFGAQGSYGGDTDLGVGARVELPLSSIHEQLSAAGSFDYFFPDGFDYFEVNANGLFSIPMEGGSLMPYVGAGLNYARIDVSVSGPFGTVGGSTSEIGLNVLGGSKFGGGDSSLTPFAEARFELSGGEQFVLTGGVLF